MSPAPSITVRTAAKPVVTQLVTHCTVRQSGDDQLGFAGHLLRVLGGGVQAYGPTRSRNWGSRPEPGVCRDASMTRTPAARGVLVRQSTDQRQ